METGQPTKGKIHEVNPDEPLDPASLGKIPPPPKEESSAIPTPPPSGNGNGKVSKQLLDDIRKKLTKGLDRLTEDITIGDTMNYLLVFILFTFE